LHNIGQSFCNYIYLLHPALAPVRGQCVVNGRPVFDALDIKEAKCRVFLNSGKAAANLSSFIVIRPFSLLNTVIYLSPVLITPISICNSIKLLYFGRSKSKSMKNIYKPDIGPAPNALLLRPKISIFTPHFIDLH
jgi:hypothetical protein